MLFLLLAALMLISIVWALQISRATEGEVVPHFPPRLSWGIALAVLGYQFFAYNMRPGIGWGLFTVTLLLGTFLALEQKQRTWLAWLALITGCTAGILLSWRANGFVMAANVFMIMGCVSTLFLLRSVDTFRWHALWKLRMTLIYAGRTLRQIPALLKLSRTPRGNEHRSSAITIINTALITIAVMTLFTLLLVSADAVFQQLVHQVLDEAYNRIFVSLVIAFGLTVALTIRLKPELNSVPTMRWFGYAEALVPTLALSVLFACFLVIQARYLYADAAAFQALHITYADYVRRGMVELLIAVAIGGMVVYALVLRQREETEPSRAWTLRTVAAVLTVELLLLLLSAYQRNALYVDAYGLTRVRLIGEIFLFWLACCLLLLLAFALFWRMQERHILQGGVGLSIAVFALLNAWNIDRVIALSPPPNHHMPDFYYTAILSGDAAEGWEQMIPVIQRLYNTARTSSALTSDQQDTLMNAKMAVKTLLNKVKPTDPPLPWQEFNVGTTVGRDVVTQHRQLLTCLSQEIMDYQLAHGLNWYQQEWAEVYGNRSTFTERDQYRPEDLQSLRTERHEPYVADACEGE